MSESFDLPLAPIQRLIKQALPPNANVSKEVKQAFGKAASLFVLYLTHTATDVCRGASRSMVNAEDVLAAVEELEFDMFLDPLQAYLKEFREEAAKKKKSKPAAAVGAGAGEDASKKRSRSKAGGAVTGDESASKKSKADSAAPADAASPALAPAAAAMEEEDELDYGDADEE